MRLEFETGARALIVSHSDADGHVIAEQSRRNLERRGVAARVFIDPRITRGYKVWDQLDALPALSDFDYVVFTDLMLSPGAPEESLRKIGAFAEAWPDRRFYLVDHHPLARPPLDLPGNVTIRFTPSVRACCVGPAGPMMRIAAICDNDEGRLRRPPTERERLIARGVRRVVMDKKRFVGAPALALIAGGFWEVFRAIGSEEAARHKQFMGSRTRTAIDSPALNQALTISQALLGNSAPAMFSGVTRKKGSTMALSGQLAGYRAPGSGPASGLTEDAASEPDAAMVHLLETAILLLNPDAGDVISPADLLSAVKGIDESGFFRSEAALEAAVAHSTQVAQAPGGYVLKALTL